MINESECDNYKDGDLILGTAPLPVTWQILTTSWIRLFYTGQGFTTQKRPDHRGKENYTELTAYTDSSILNFKSGTIFSRISLQLFSMSTSRRVSATTREFVWNFAHATTLSVY